MELRHLRYFQAVAREEHFGRAAQSIRIAQPALTRQIRDLEAELGLLLFERLPRGVRLSSAGRAFLEETNAILDQIQRSVGRVKGYANGHFGTVRIGYSEIASRHRDIAAKILKFRLSEPNIELNLLPMGSQLQIEALRNGSLDVGIVYDIHRHEEDFAILGSQDIGESNIVLALYSGHPLTRRKDLRMQDLADERFLFPIRKSAPRYYDRLMKACLTHGVSPNIIQEIATHSILLSLVAVGMGVGFTEYSNDSQPESVLFREVKDLDISFRVHLLWRKSDSSPAVLRFVEAMR
jgi:DNA-binding transcriptional LysR family regulator